MQLFLAIKKIGITFVQKHNLKILNFILVHSRIIQIKDITTANQNI